MRGGVRGATEPGGVVSIQERMGKAEEAARLESEGALGDAISGVKPPRMTAEVDLPPALL